MEEIRDIHHSNIFKDECIRVGMLKRWAKAL